MRRRCMWRQSRRKGKAVCKRSDRGGGDEDFRCSNLFTVCQRRRGFSDEEETKCGVLLFSRENQFVVVVAERFER